MTLSNQLINIPVGWGLTFVSRENTVYRYSCPAFVHSQSFCTPFKFFDGSHKPFKRTFKVFARENTAGYTGLKRDLSIQLITVYLYVCKHYEQNLWIYCQRMSNHVDLSFSGEEVIALYLFGIMDKNREIKQIYRYADRHLRCWYPALPSYVACVAPGLADHGYCSTKKFYFYGVRVHVIGRKQAGTLPSPEYIGVIEN